MVAAGARSAIQRYVIVSGSMTGTYDRGSRRLRPRSCRSKSLKVGDVITYRPPARRRPGPPRSRTASPRSTADRSRRAACSAPRATPTRSPTRGRSRCPAATQARVARRRPLRRLRASPPSRTAACGMLRDRPAGRADRPHRASPACGATPARGPARHPGGTGVKRVLLALAVARRAAARCGVGPLGRDLRRRHARTPAATLRRPRRTSTPSPSR